jgi:hypothetical protein
VTSRAGSVIPLSFISYITFFTSRIDFICSISFRTLSRSTTHLGPSLFTSVFTTSFESACCLRTLLGLTSGLASVSDFGVTIRGSVSLGVTLRLRFGLASVGGTSTGTGSTTAFFVRLCFNSVFASF